MGSSRPKNNGARLSRLIIDQGTEAMRKHFHTIHPVSNLNTVLNAYKSTLQKVKVIKPVQMDTLFPPSGLSDSSDYDITLLYILFRNICGLSPPSTTGSWDKYPPSTDLSSEADLARIKYYRNEVYGHIKSTEVSDADFNDYWNDISDALIRLGADAVDIASLKTGLFDEEFYIVALSEWYESEHKNEILGGKILKSTEAIERTVNENNVLAGKTLESAIAIKEAGNRRKVLVDKAAENTAEIKEIVKKNTRNINRITAIMFMLLVVLVGSVVFIGLCYVFLRNRFSNESDYSYNHNLTNPHFVGREWLFRMLENTLNTNNVRGVQLVSDLGWGKSAIVKHLINSPSSSAVIHENIIGFHFCKYNEKTTREGGQFVKNLVQQISKNISGFQDDGFLGSNCDKEPGKCFKSALVKPLKKLNATGRKFILIDALDECLEKEERHQSVILNILSSSVPDLPAWVKLIVTSRNQAQTTGKMSKIGLSTLKLNVDDQRNKRDLRNYTEQALQNFYIEVHPTKEKLPLKDVVDLAVEFSKGNFLFLERIIRLWQEFPDKMNAESVPEDLGNIYTSSFAMRFNEADFKDFKPLLEVLLAANSPPTLSELSKVLEHHYKNHQTRTIANKLSEYFKSDIEEGPIEFHHQCFAEWLIKQTKGIDGIVIEKSRGHQYIADYLFDFYDERRTNLTFEELSELCTHILHGEKESLSNVRKLSSLKVTEVKDSSKASILHYLAPNRNAKKLIDALAKQFNSVDVPDDEDWTPVMYAVKAGSYDNVKLFLDYKANVSHAVKRTFCFFWDLMVLRDSYETKSSMNFIAAYRGHTKIAKLLARKGAEIDKVDECGWKSLYAAAVMGHFEIVQLYINKGAEPDVISLHHAAARNHTEIARLLLKTGLRDRCLPCKHGNISWCRANLNRFHHCFCETALHAAVSRDNLEMAALIFQYGNASVNCKHGSGRTPLMEAFLRKNTQMIKLLIKNGADIHAGCEHPTSDLFYDCNFIAYEVKEWLYSRYCNQPVCYNGNSAMQFAVTQGVWKMAIPYILKGKLNASKNASEVTDAGIYDRVGFINAMYGNRINSIPNVETLLRYVAICHSVKTLEHLLTSDDLSKFSIVYEDGKTLLHFATLGSSKRVTEEYVTQSCVSSACVCPNQTRTNIGDGKRLKTVKHLIKVLSLQINKQDKYGRTALHYAAVHVLPDVVEYLANAGADWSIKDQTGSNAMEFALQERPIRDVTVLPCRLTSDKAFRLCQSSSFDVMISYLLQNETIKKCDGRAKNLLSRLVSHKLPESLYNVFKSGLRVNCAQEQFKAYLNETVSTHWNRKRDELLEVFKIFQIDVHVTCGVPFAQSELHLMAYLGTPSLKSGNLFQSSVNGRLFPLERFLASHLETDVVKLFNECYDKEGYLPIHRAVQGTNLDAISWFIEIGVDISRKTKYGLNALVLATYNYPSSPTSTFSTLDSNKKLIFDKVLEEVEKKSQGHDSFQCNTELVDVSPLHVAAGRGTGVLDAIRQKMPAFPLICTNSDGIQPFYLAYLYHDTHPYTSWNDKQAAFDLGLSLESGPSKYPKPEAEYHLIYNQFYRTPNEDLRNLLNHDGLFECPGINELLPHKTIIQEYIRLNGCSTRCWMLGSEASCEFSSNFRYLEIQSIISNPFADKFINIAHHMAELRFYLVKMFHFHSFRFKSISILEKKLWRKVTKAHACAQRCSCFEIMQLLQEKLTSEPLEFKKVGKLVAKRMGWTDTANDGDVTFRWPFNFLLKKALRLDNAYKYLEILSPRF